MFNTFHGMDQSAAEVQIILSAEPKNFRAHILYEFDRSPNFFYPFESIVKAKNKAFYD
jgi:hypothetical protein